MRTHGDMDAWVYIFVAKAASLMPGLLTSGKTPVLVLEKAEWTQDQS